MWTSSSPFMTLTPGNSRRGTSSSASHDKIRKRPPTASLSGVVEQDAVYWCSDQNRPSGLLNDGDHVIGDFSGSASGVPAAVEVVRDQKTVHGEAGVLRDVACSPEENPAWL